MHAVKKTSELTFFLKHNHAFITHEHLGTDIQETDTQEDIQEPRNHH